MKSIKFDGTSYSTAWIKAHSREQFIKKVSLSDAKAGELYDLVVVPTVEAVSEAEDVELPKTEKGGKKGKKRD